MLQPERHLDTIRRLPDGHAVDGGGEDKQPDDRLDAWLHPQAPLAQRDRRHHEHGQPAEAVCDVLLCGAAGKLLRFQGGEDELAAGRQACDVHVGGGLGASYDLVGAICCGGGALARIEDNSAWIDIFMSNARFDTTLQVQLESDLILEPRQAERPKGRPEAVIDAV
eukprot:CAMPEP_0172209744 /NCGR_PEP_ID=MMETSP1050-20130122/35322_1 /TAXON_ID=233186 /ORGANISM="Cryptomonas curvata, Strain CCAP979/52" /LENGTH=166 /DNA_ID=CAMNT_0012889729 /DNA_START=771 /DNA_END=1271 /DNA_ORIENTATION=-